VSRYWFFSATLPGFLFGSPPPYESSEFMELCARYLSAEDCKTVSDSVNMLYSEKESSKAGSRFFNYFAAWERSFRNEIARLRARRACRDVDAHLRPTQTDDDAAKAAAACFSIEDPYQAEVAVERERWNAVERFSALCSFDTDFIIAYRLKLAIAERLALLEPSTGAAGYRHLYNDILGKASSNAESVSLGEKA
jgi:hypothetical protein